MYCRRLFRKLPSATKSFSPDACLLWQSGAFLGCYEIILTDVGRRCDVVTDRANSVGFKEFLEWFVNGFAASWIGSFGKEMEMVLILKSLPMLLTVKRLKCFFFLKRFVLPMNTNYYSEATVVDNVCCYGCDAVSLNRLILWTGALFQMRPIDHKACCLNFIKQNTPCCYFGPLVATVQLFMYFI